MKKITMIYWSSGGNVEVLANAIAEGIKETGAELTIKHVSEAMVEDITSADAVAFGSPSMDNNRIEQHQMEPFINQFELLPNNNKETLLFGSYGWDEGSFMKDWEDKMKGYGFNVISTFAVNESPSSKELSQAKELGKELAMF
ncbi:flavodoxin [Clostridium polynesiense]|uniref:flavodoxin n=1 Tax=Clostridium polynesiense TaxID=1325933 RepID=UPI00058E81ED|nr:flavodoxin [Clostridium polynesiense]